MYASRSSDHADTKFDLARTSCGVFYWTFQNYMSKRAEKARLARASVIKLCWPLSFALTLLFCAVLLVLFTNSGKQTVRSSRQCAKEDSFCQVHLSASLRSFFQMWAVAVRFLNAKRSAQRHRFVGIAVRLTIGPLTSLVTYTAVVFLAGYLLTCGDVESNPGPGPGERLDYPWRQPPTRHGTTTDTITRQAACSAGERSANQTRYHSANTTASASGPSGALTRMEAYILQLSDDTPKRLQQMERQQTTLSNTLSTWTPGASPFSARTTSLRRTFVISLQGVRFCRTKLVISTTGRTTSMTYARVQTTRWTN